MLELILEGARSLNLVRTIKDREYFDLKSVPPSAPPTQEDEDQDEEASQGAEEPLEEEQQQAPRALEATRLKRVYVSHGKNLPLLDPIKKLLGFGELEPR